MIIQGSRIGVAACFVLMSLLGCVYHDLTPAKSNCSGSSLSIRLDSLFGATACGVADGRIYVAVEGGLAPYHLFLNQSLSSFDKLRTLLPGVYEVAITDSLGCTTTLSNLDVLGNLSIGTTVKEDNACQAHNGMISFTPGKVNGPLLFKLGDGAYSSDSVFNDLAAGAYDVMVKDTSNCSTKLHLTVARGKTNTSWSNDILPIIKSSCAGSGCHDGKSRVDYRIYDNASKKAAEIRQQTQSRSMPFGGATISDADIQSIACWVDDGALEN